MLTPIRKIGPLFESTRFKDLKDPCIAFDGTTWHIYGSGGDTLREEWEILHATAPALEGPWTEEETVRLRGVEGAHVAAPSVIYDADDKLFHMAVQKDFMAVGGDIAYLVSADGHVFTKMRSLVTPKGSSEAGLYDPHLSAIAGKKYLAYSGIPAIIRPDRPFIPQPDVYLARSLTGLWTGRWKRIRKILDHDEIAWHHNRREHPDYEWGIEGPQVIELRPGLYLLNATCFVEEGPRGTRQRVFFAIADDIEGPYTSLGPVLTGSTEEWEDGENGHASAWMEGDELYLFYQARSKKDRVPAENRWRYGIAVFRVEDIIATRESEDRAR